MSLQIDELVMSKNCIPFINDYRHQHGSLKFAKVCCILYNGDTEMHFVNYSFVYFYKLTHLVFVGCYYKNDMLYKS